AKISSLPLYIDSKFNEPNWINENIQELETFSKILSKIGQVYGLSTSQMNIFYAPSSDVIAFNRDKCLFFGFAYYRGQLNQNIGMKTIIASWFVTMAHELAHNFTSYHNM